jgi:hypothetical protein
MNESQLIKTIKAHIAKGDHASEKAEQHYISAGQHLATLKKEHAGSWDEWTALLKIKVGISTGRASELMQIADGRKTVEQVRADTNRRKIEHRKPSFQNEEDEPIETNEAKINALLRRAERARLYARFDGVPNKEVMEAAGLVANAWHGLHADMLLADTKVGDGLCQWVKDDGGRAASGIANSNNRRTETGDCVTRAIAIATGKPYAEVHDALTVRTVRHVYDGGDSRYPEWSKWAKRRGGVRAFDPDHGCPLGAYGPYLASLGWRCTSTKSQRIRLRADELPPGRLVVHIRQHLVAVIDGVIHDIYDSGGSGRVRVQHYWTAPKAAA